MVATEPGHVQALSRIVNPRPAVLQARAQIARPVGDEGPAGQDLGHILLRPEPRALRKEQHARLGVPAGVGSEVRQHAHHLVPREALPQREDVVAVVDRERDVGEVVAVWF